MTGQLGRRFALVMLVSMTLAAVMGLVAWGPILLTDAAHHYADERVWLGVPGTVNVLINVPMFALGVWGWRATRASAWPMYLKTPWQLFHLCAILSAIVAAIYHALPSDRLFVLAHASTAGGFVTLTLGLLAERVHMRFGSVAWCRLALLAITLIGGAMLIGRSITGALDMRPLALLEIIPVLVIPAGALALPGPSTRVFDWMIVLTLFTLSKVFEAGDATILQATGWVGGHALMHLALAAAVGWMAYCAAAARGIGAAGSVGSGDTSQRETSLNTTS